ncbi:kinase-like domain-containing protein [Gigaspora rosea]|uniref:Kinase-like domain-containing protein n=1 Tax=Gigaspora rosea TaxID=44941 RepID=A0A397W281_9GLOM|nr:kinase-like domain-containing protein [Gigaspora rosea]
MGSLRDNLYYVSKMEWEKKLLLLTSIASDLQKIHSQGLIHRDLHSGNILLRNLYSAYIADLGLSALVNIGSSNNQICGIPPYIAPEVLSNGNKEYSTASDVYSFGIIAYEVVSGLPVYHDIPHDINLLSAIYNGLRPSIPQHVPKLVKELIIKCWDGQKDKRPTSEDIFNTLNMWDSSILSDTSTEMDTQISSDETVELIPIHVKIHSEVTYTSRKFAPLSSKYIINSD